MMPEKSLAISVINRAIEDFESRGLSDMPLSQSAFFARSGNKHAYRLTALREKIRAGEFLLERTDTVKVLWFTLAGIALDGPRHNRGWQERLKGLKEAERGLLRARPKLAATVRRYQTVDNGHQGAQNVPRNAKARRSGLLSVAVVDGNHRSEVRMQRTTRPTRAS